jgi:hypothetical protein
VPRLQGDKNFSPDTQEPNDAADDDKRAAKPGQALIHGLDSHEGKKANSFLRWPSSLHRRQKPLRALHHRAQVPSPLISGSKRSIHSPASQDPDE